MALKGANEREAFACECGTNGTASDAGMSAKLTGRTGRQTDRRVDRQTDRRKAGAGKGVAQTLQAKTRSKGEAGCCSATACQAVKKERKAERQGEEESKRESRRMRRREGSQEGGGTRAEQQTEGGIKPEKFARTFIAFKFGNCRDSPSPPEHTHMHTHTCTCDWQLHPHCDTHCGYFTAANCLSDSRRLCRLCRLQPRRAAALNLANLKMEIDSLE